MRFVLAIALGLGPVANPPSLSDPQAQAELDRAMEAFAAEDFATAAEALEKAYAIEPDDSVFIAWAQAERLDGDCPRALELYAQYLDAERTDDEIRTIEELMLPCQEEESAAEPAVPAAPDPAAPSEPPPPEETAPGPSPPADTSTQDPTPSDGSTDDEEVPPDTRTRRPWSKNPAGIGLAVSAGVLAGVGVGLLVGARIADANADDEPDHAAFRGRLDRAIALERASIGLFSVAGAVAIGSAIAFGVAARRSRVRPSAWLGPSTAGFSIMSSF